MTVRELHFWMWLAAVEADDRKKEALRQRERTGVEAERIERERRNG
jgi:hypothetical protein